MKRWQVWVVVPVGESLARTGKAPRKSTWLDVTKSDLVQQIIRNRLGTKEFANYKSAEF